MSIVQQIHQLIPGWTSQTQVNTLLTENETLQITNTFIRKLLRATCHNFGVKTTFGFNQANIGNKSLQSSVAMALFLQTSPPHASCSLAVGLPGLHLTAWLGVDDKYEP
jgi:hypothetical protein